MWWLWSHLENLHQSEGFGAVLYGDLLEEKKSIVKGFDKLWGLWGRYNWRARSNFIKSVQKKKVNGRYLLEKKPTKPYWVVEFYPVSCTPGFFLHMHEEGTCQGTRGIFSKQNLNLTSGSCRC